MTFEPKSEDHFYVWSGPLHSNSKSATSIPDPRLPSAWNRCVLPDPLQLGLGRLEGWRQQVAHVAGRLVEVKAHPLAS